MIVLSADCTCGYRIKDGTLLTLEHDQLYYLAHLHHGGSCETDAIRMGISGYHEEPSVGQGVVTQWLFLAIYVERCMENHHRRAKF